MRPVKPCFQNGYMSVRQAERSLVGLQVGSSVETYLDVFQLSGRPCEPGKSKKPRKLWAREVHEMHIGGQRCFVDENEIGDRRDVNDEMAYL